MGRCEGDDVLQRSFVKSATRTFRQFWRVRPSLNWTTTSMISLLPPSTVHKSHVSLDPSLSTTTNPLYSPLITHKESSKSTWPPRHNLFIHFSLVGVFCIFFAFFRPVFFFSIIFFCSQLIAVHAWKETRLYPSDPIPTIYAQPNLTLILKRARIEVT